MPRYKELNSLGIRENGEMVMVIIVFDRGTYCNPSLLICHRVPWLSASVWEPL